MYAERKIVINTCYGIFGISPEAALWLFERGMKNIAYEVSEYYNKGDCSNHLHKWKEFLLGKVTDSYSVTVFSPDERFVLSTRPEKRDDPLLIECIETLGERAFGALSELKIVSIPADVEWEIEGYDGKEWISEKHRTWS